MSVVCSCKGFHRHVHCGCSQPLQDFPFLKRKAVLVRWKTCKHQCSSSRSVCTNNLDSRGVYLLWKAPTLNFRPFTYYCTRSAELQEKYGQVFKFTARLPGHLFNSGISVHLDLQDHFLKTSSSLTWQQQQMCKKSWLKRNAKSLSWPFTLLEKLSTAVASVFPHTYKPMSSPWNKWNFQERQWFFYTLLLARFTLGNGAWQIAVQINYLRALTCHLAGLCLSLLP